MLVHKEKKVNQENQELLVHPDQVVFLENQEQLVHKVCPDDEETRVLLEILVNLVQKVKLVHLVKKVQVVHLVPLVSLVSIHT